MYTEMAPTPSSLLVKFRERDTAFGVTRDTVKSLAAFFGVSETEVIHLALSRMATQELPGYEQDDGPLSAQDLRHLRKIAKAALPKGETVSEQSLF